MRLFDRRARAQAAVGVYIADNVLSVASIEHDRGRRPRLVQADCRELDATSDREKLLRSLVPSGRIPVNLVLASRHYELLLVEAPRVEPSELRAAIRWKVKNLIDFHIDDAVVDVFEIPGQQNRPQGQSMMYAIAVRAREIRNHVDQFSTADLNLEVIDVADMALRNLAALLDDDARGVAMIYLDEDRGVITLTRQGSLFLSRRLETGTRQIEQRGPEAFDQITLEVQRSLDYYDSHFAQPPISSVQVLPGLSGSDALATNLGDGLNVPVHTFDPKAVLECQVPIPAEHVGAVLIAIGGALRHEEVSL